MAREVMAYSIGDTMGEFWEKQYPTEQDKIDRYYQVLEALVRLVNERNIIEKLVDSNKLEAKSQSVRDVYGAAAEGLV